MRDDGQVRPGAVAAHWGDRDDQRTLAAAEQVGITELLTLLP